MATVDCGHINGCQCEDVPLTRVGCGTNVQVTCQAAIQILQNTGRNPINGAWTHTLADLFTQLDEMGYVLAKKSKPE